MNNSSTHKPPIIWRLRTVRISAWLLLIGLVVFSLIPLNTPQIQVAGGDKWLHLLSYFGVSFCIFNAYLEHSKRCFWGMIVLGLVLETLQGLTPYRYFEWLDMLMNILGVLLAYGLFLQLKIRLIKWLST